MNLDDFGFTKIHTRVVQGRRVWGREKLEYVFLLTSGKNVFAIEITVQ